MNAPTGVDEGIYRLRIGAKRVLIPMSGGEGNVTINGDLNSLDSYGFEATGSAFWKKVLAR